MRPGFVDFFYFCFVLFYSVCSQLNLKKSDLTTCTVTNCRRKTRKNLDVWFLTQLIYFPSYILSLGDPTARVYRLPREFSTKHLWGWQLDFSFF